MRIDKDGDDVEMVLSKQDMIDLKNMFDSHMMIPKYSITSGQYMQQGLSTQSLWPGVKNWYNQMYGGPQTTQSPHWGTTLDPIPYPKPEDSFEILGKLIRAFDLILENKNTGGKEIE